MVGVMVIELESESGVRVIESGSRLYSQEKSTNKNQQRFPQNSQIILRFLGSVVIHDSKHGDHENHILMHLIVHLVCMLGAAMLDPALMAGTACAGCV